MKELLLRIRAIFEGRAAAEDAAVAIEDVKREAEEADAALGAAGEKTIAPTVDKKSVEEAKAEVDGLKEKLDQVDATTASPKVDVGGTGDGGDLLDPEWEAKLAEIDRELAKIEGSLGGAGSEAKGLLDTLRRIPGPAGELGRRLSDAHRSTKDIGGGLGNVINSTLRWAGILGTAVYAGKFVHDQLHQWADRINEATAESERLGDTFHKNGMALLQQAREAKTLADIQSTQNNLAEERLRIQSALATASAADQAMLSSQLAQLDGINATIGRILSLEQQQAIFHETGRQARIDAAQQQETTANRILHIEREIANVRATPLPTEDDARRLETLERTLVVLQARRDSEQELARQATATAKSQLELEAATRAGNTAVSENIQFNLDLAAALQATSGNEKLSLQIATQKAKARRDQRDAAVEAAKEETALAVAIAKGDTAREERIRTEQDFRAALAATGDKAAAKEIAHQKSMLRELDRQKSIQEENQSGFTKHLQDQIALERERATTRAAELEASGADEKTIAEARVASAERIREIEMQIAEMQGTAAQAAALHAEQRKQDALAIAAAETSAKGKPDAIRDTKSGDLFDGTNRRRGAFTSDTFERSVGIDPNQSLLDQHASKNNSPVGARGGQSILPDRKAPTPAASESSSAIADAAQPAQEAADSATESAAALKAANQALAAAEAAASSAASEVSAAAGALKSSLSQLRADIAALKRAAT